MFFFFLRSQIQNILDVPIATSGVEYLGYNLFLHREKSMELRIVIDSIIVKTESWRSCLVSKDGKETYVKSVCLSLPTYSINTF